MNCPEDEKQEESQPSKDVGEKAGEVLGALISCEIALSCFYFGLHTSILLDFP